jgi:TetR/AcrR family transcriptional repressor of bet genes
VSRARPANTSLEASRGRATRIRQRQRLIDACISALHIHGPSRTTVEKVVSIADLSPGIVRFYFDSKAAMLVASLEYLASEFEERVLLPVSQLRQSPVRALELLVDLYLDPEIASPRKVSVWYSFWGEASSRQEYYDICGKKDEDFAALVRELIERLIAQSGAAHLDADGIALGLIGVLEILWQTFAFQSESSIDRAAARARSLAYLRSVFPGQFGPASATESIEPADRTAAPVGQPGDPAGAAAAALAAAPAVDHAIAGNARLPAWAYAHAALLAAERDRLLRPAWQIIGHDTEVPAAGDFLSADLAGERALVVRDERGRLRAFRNACRRRPHALVIARAGHFEGAIHCASHNLTYRLDGRLVDGDTPGDLSSLELKQCGRLILVRAAGTAAGATRPRLAAASDDAASEIDWGAFDRMASVSAQRIEVAADWKLIVERWLEAPASPRQFLPPNQLIEVRRDTALILQVIPVAAGRCRIQRFDYIAAAAPRRAAAAGGWQRQVNAWLQQEIALAESTQTGLAGAPDELEDSGPIAGPLAQFRQLITALLPAIPTLPERAL